MTIDVINEQTHLTTGNRTINSTNQKPSKIKTPNTVHKSSEEKT